MLRIILILIAALLAIAAMTMMMIHGVARLGATCATVRCGIGGGAAAEYAASRVAAPQ